MSALSNHRFLKMNGLGNEITVLDLRGSLHVVSSAEARAIAADSRSRFDQLMVLHDPVSPGTDAYLRIYNTDGTESGACGNGTRCVAWAMLADPIMSRPVHEGLVLETKAGLLPVTRVSDTVFTVDMGPPRLSWNEIPLRDPYPDTRAIAVDTHIPEHPELQSPSAVGMGNPHAIFWVENAQAYDLTAVGPKFEHDPVFPERANISFAEVVSPDHVVLRVWERGAGATRACGSAACATLVAGARKGLTGRKAKISLPGGDLLIEWRESDDHVLMTGETQLEHEGFFVPALFAGAA
ncbi:diaminopimelate epimerase [Microvirga guangxiensis]|uniref:Diaminopimelate epimerase n=1 Tax=Microvirga guangxiensis TaxID=549386 RepID=A0A1G5DQF5_9HYPH|nr:diaminopimelate epimerase [Microvirga guangxiensis]SCY16700.1 diaminopimelate epimerase [Microvirga guangxiensis]